eukprot:GHVU01182734.1.p1 GENE.GHVU01182734.1~~GHVU01182734.1.p1  ORF type:complete len:172 (+),score=39.53 GHVU01182734.1:236-751(+)
METGSLLELIEDSRLECLNQKSSQGLRNATHQPNTDLYLESDADHELLIKIGFQRPVRLSSIGFKASEQHLDQGPRSVKLFVDDLNMSFADAESSNPLQTLVLEREDVRAGKTFDLRHAKFKNMTGLVIFVDSNQEDEDTTIIGHLSLKGAPVNNMNMKDWKPPEKSEEMD